MLHHDATSSCNVTSCFAQTYFFKQNMTWHVMTTRCDVTWCDTWLYKHVTSWCDVTRLYRHVCTQKNVGTKHDLTLKLGSQRAYIHFALHCGLQCASLLHSRYFSIVQTIRRHFKSDFYQSLYHFKLPALGFHVLHRPCLVTSEVVYPGLEVRAATVFRHCSS